MLRHITLVEVLNLLKGLCQTVEGRRTFAVVFRIPKGRQLGIHCSHNERSFSEKRISVTRITMAQMA